MHIPKTSGIAVAHALIQAARPEGHFFGFDRAFFGGFDAFDTVGPQTRAFIHLSPADLPAEERLVRAHMAFSTLSAGFPRGQLLTVLREPTARLLSHYLFWRGFTAAQLADWGAWADRMQISLQPLTTFLDHPAIACQVDNVATRLLLWPHPAIPADGFIDPADDATLLAAARARLSRFDFADALENPDFADNLSAWLGRKIAIGRHNETPRLPDRLRFPLGTALTQDALACLAARTRLDNQLWADVLTARGRRDTVALRARAKIEAVSRFAQASGRPGSAPGVAQFG